MPIERFTRRRRGRWKRERTYHQSTAPPWVVPQPSQLSQPSRPRAEVPPGATLERDEFRPKTASDLLPPLVWSVVLGTFIGVVAGMVDGTVRAGLTVGGGCAALSFLASSFPVVWQDGPGVVAMAERITRRDLDGDGVVGVPEPQRQLVTIRVDDGNTSRYLNDIPRTAELRSFARGVVDGSVTFSERGARGCGVDRATFVQVRDQLIDRGMVTWKNEHSAQAGYHIRPIARHALGELARLPLPPGAGR